MTTSQTSEFQRRLAIKTIIVEECEKDIDPEQIDDKEPLFGRDARLGLDSIDALQLSLALQKRFGVRLTDSKDLRRAFATVASLDEYLQRHG
jgi:acyl carrier protein